MRIAIDESHLNSFNLSAHSVRGAGKYALSLEENLKNFDKDNYYEVLKSPAKSLSGFDIVHFPYFEPFFLSLPLKVDLPSVVTVHDLIPLIFPDKFPVGIKGRAKWSIQKLALKNKTVVVTDSLSSKRDIEKITGINPERIKVVYLASSPVFKKDTKNKTVLKKFNLPDDFFIYVGDVTWNKNLITLSEVVKKTDINIVMVGKSLVNEKVNKENLWNKDFIKFKELTKNDKRFHFTGFVTEREMKDLYNLAKGLLLPSYYEGFGLPVLEAMQSGCPVICSNKGSLPEVGGKAVYYIDPYNIDSITNAVSDLSENVKLRDELIRKGLIQAKNFSWEKVVSEMTKIYKEII